MRMRSLVVHWWCNPGTQGGHVGNPSAETGLEPCQESSQTGGAQQPESERKQTLLRWWVEGARADGIRTDDSVVGMFGADTAQMQDLVDAQIPVKITGQLDDPKVRPDIQGYVKGRVKEELKKEEEKLKEKIGDKLKDLFTR